MSTKTQCDICEETITNNYMSETKSVGPFHAGGTSRMVKVEISVYPVAVTNTAVDLCETCRDQAIKEAINAIH
jgi:hypothetical protein